MADRIGHSEGAVSGGSSFTYAWRDREGFHRFYASDYASEREAKKAAFEGATMIGYVPAKWWQFWR